MKARDREATRQRLFDAARTLFAEHGYEHVTVRMIAAEADANVALVTRYFGSKAELFAEVLAGEPSIQQVFGGDPGELPRRLAQYAAKRMYAEPESPILRSLERSAGHPEIQGVVRDRLRNVIIEPLARMLRELNDHTQAAGAGGSGHAHAQALARARLVTSIFLGIGTVRRMVGPENPTPADIDRLTAVFTEALRP